MSTAAHQSQDNPNDMEPLISAQPPHPDAEQHEPTGATATPAVDPSSDATAAEPSATTTKNSSEATINITAAYFNKVAKHPDDFHIGSFAIPAEPPTDHVRIKPPTDHVRIKVYAAALNPIDWERAQKGTLGRLFPIKYPSRVGYDVAGVVSKLGAGVTRFNPGDAVYGRLNHETGVGSVADYVDIAADDIAHKPSCLRFNQAAAIPLAGLTALQALRASGLAEGKNIFVNAGAGGVGSFALQLAKNYFRATKVSTTVSTSKVEVAMGLGAAEAIDYTKKDFVKELGPQYDVAIDTVGEHSRIAKILRPHASPPSKFVSIVGVPNSAEVGPLLDQLRRQGLFGAAKAKFIGKVLDASQWWKMRDLRKRGIDYGFVFARSSGEDLDMVFNALIEGGALQVPIDSTYEFSESGLRSAFSRLMEGKVAGKVVICMKKG
ncbi:hypothetical protein EV182_000655 [Spiromyces aspiralis]|uniref:Uncharacterized protein n=1 Tax=Spiromyces aspiralis TaxID=68401 RepID=A0ACC1HVP8_9FUNG|nr:hypothetical protein EV182_000655 [Spiromyces aspiralis]